MNLKAFSDFVEIKTKVASLVPFILGLLFAYYRYSEFNGINTLIYFICLISLDMAATAINHYEGYKRGEDFNPMEEQGISRKSAIAFILLLLALSIAAGLFLVIETDYVILFIGILSVMIGVLYSFGPVPLSATPFGELASGGTMGFIIFFVAVYIQVPGNTILQFTLDRDVFSLQLNLPELLPLLLVSLPMIFMIANIMLANNICDVECDMEKQRYTLPHFLGNRSSVFLWIALYGFSYLVLIIAVVLGILPLLTLLVLISLFPAIPLLKEFAEKQDKRETFINSIKVFLIISVLWIFSFILHFILKGFL